MLMESARVYGVPDEGAVGFCLDFFSKGCAGCTRHWFDQGMDFSNEQLVELISLCIPAGIAKYFALENGPFYAAECGVALTLANLGGLESDSDCHVYNTDREIIPGLYVAGAPQGGRFNVQYPISLKGLSCGMCMVFGKIAGENAAAGK